MRIAAFQRWFLRLSLAATFALALVPTLGRVAQAANTTPAQAWTAMCTVAGLVQVAIDPAHDPGPPADHAGQGDCAYCPLLQSLQVPQATLAVAPPSLGPTGPPNAARTIAVAFRHPAGLGSRGPPVLS